MTHAYLGRDLLLRFADQVQDHGTVERQPLLEGKSMWMVITSTHKPKVQAASHVDGEAASQMAEPVPTPAASVPEPSATAAPVPVAEPAPAKPPVKPAATPKPAAAKTAPAKPAPAKPAPAVVAVAQEATEATPPAGDR